MMMDIDPARPRGAFLDGRKSDRPVVVAANAAAAV